MFVVHSFISDVVLLCGAAAAASQPGSVIGLCSLQLAVMLRTEQEHQRISFSFIDTWNWVPFVVSFSLFSSFSRPSLRESKCNNNEGCSSGVYVQNE